MKLELKLMLEQPTNQFADKVIQVLEARIQFMVTLLVTNRDLAVPVALDKLQSKVFKDSVIDFVSHQ